MIGYGYLPLQFGLERGVKYYTAWGLGELHFAIIIGNEVTGKYSMVFKCKCKLNLDYRLQSPPSAGGADFNE